MYVNIFRSLIFSSVVGDSRQPHDVPREERAAIVAKYELGRNENAHIYPWEDPGFEVYHVTDRYGFLQ